MWYGFQCKQVWSNAYMENKFRVSVPDGWVKSVEEERDLGVLMSKDLKFSKLCLFPKKKKVNLMLGIINRRISYKSVEVI